MYRLSSEGMFDNNDKNDNNDNDDENNHDNNNNDNNNNNNNNNNNKHVNRNDNDGGCSTSFWWHYLSNATCLIRLHLFYACFVVSRITIICYSIHHF